MKLSVIIVNYNVRYFLEQCLITVAKAIEQLDAEVIVVDNDSVDGSVEMVQKSFPHFGLIANTENLGFSKANNQALRIAKGEYVLLLNPDTVVQEDTFSKCLEFMDSNQDVGGLGVRMIDGKGNFLPESKRGLPTPEVALYKMLGLSKLFPRSKRFGKYHLGYLKEMDTNEVDVLAGAYMMMRKSVLDEIGLLDETFFMYGEDIDLSYRITGAGYKNVYFPETSIIHYKGESTKKMSANYVFIFYKAMVIFAKKHYKGSSAFSLTTLINGAIYLRAAFALVQRFVSVSWLFVVDALSLLGGMFFLKNYWEEHIKGIESYPPELMQIHVPYYILFWVLTVYMSGGYQRPFSFKRILRGIVVGTVLITAVYGLFPNELRFSRALIFLGAIWATVAMTLIRLLSHFKTYGTFALGDRGTLNTVVVGSGGEKDRVIELLKSTDSPINVLGWVDVKSDKSEGALGKIDRLKDICQIYNVHELIFCAKDIPSSQIFIMMGDLVDSSVNFKIVPEERYFVIGSNSKNTSGEFFSEEIHYKLSDEYNLRKKRLLDLLMCLLLGVFSPILCWFGQGPIKYFKNWIRVFLGRATWIGYDPAVGIAHLPKIKTGTFFVSNDHNDVKLTAGMIEQLNFLYAKNYSAETDFFILMKAIFKA